MHRLTTLIGCIALALPVPAAVFHNVRDYGAKGDGAAKDTAAVQAAIDAAEKEGGGLVVLPAGRYLSGTIHLKSNVEIHIAAGATLLASRDEADFDKYEQLPYPTPDDEETSYFRYALLAGENIHNVTIAGAGTIDGNRPKRHGPKPIAIKSSQHISIRGITLVNAPNYTISFQGCDFIDVDGVSIHHAYADGIDLDNCRWARIANCYIEGWDDAICLKTSMALGERRSTEHIVVTNCVLRVTCANFKLGSESAGDFKDITVSNCSFSRRPNDLPAIAGIALESVDGANIDGLVISNIVMQEVRSPIFMRLGNRARGPVSPGSLENVIVSNIIAKGATITSNITGLAGHPVRNITLENIRIDMAGGGDKFGGLEVPEVPPKYPEPIMFGDLPASGFYVRHAEGFTMRNVRARWEKPDVRPAAIFDDVKDLDLAGFVIETATGNNPALWLHNVSDGFIQGSRAPRGAALFLRVSGQGTRGIALDNAVRQAVDVTREVAPDAVALEKK
jgi:polygalacturonase